MAEEDEAAGGPAPAGGSVLKKYGALAAIVLLVQVVVAWVVIKTLMDSGSPQDNDPGDPLIPQQQEQLPNSEEDGMGLPYQHLNEVLSKITFNPAETNSERFAVLGIVLGLMATDDEGGPMKPTDIATDPSLALVDSNTPLIRRTIVRVLREKTIDDLESNNIEEVWKDVKSALNQEVFSKIRWTDDIESKKQIIVQEIIATDIIIQ